MYMYVLISDSEQWYYCWIVLTELVLRSLLRLEEELAADEHAADLAGACDANKGRLDDGPWVHRSYKSV